MLGLDRNQQTDMGDANDKRKYTGENTRTLKVGRWSFSYNTPN